MSSLSFQKFSENMEVWGRKVAGKKRCNHGGRPDAAGNDDGADGTSDDGLVQLLDAISWGADKYSYERMILVVRTPGTSVVPKFSPILCNRV